VLHPVETAPLKYSTNMHISRKIVEIHAYTMMPMVFLTNGRNMFVLTWRGPAVSLCHKSIGTTVNLSSTQCITFPACFPGGRHVSLMFQKMDSFVLVLGGCHCQLRACKQDQYACSNYAKAKPHYELKLSIAYPGLTGLTWWCERGVLVVCFWSVLESAPASKNCKWHPEALFLT